MVELTDLELLEINIKSYQDYDNISQKETYIYSKNGNYFALYHKL